MLTHLIPIGIWYYRWSRNSCPHFTDETVETQATLHCSSRSQSHMMAKWEGMLKNAEGSEGQLIKQVLWLSGQGQFLEILVPTHMQFTREQLAYSISFWRVISFLDHFHHLLSCSKHASFCSTCSITSTCRVRTWRPFAYSHLATPGAGATSQSRAYAGACRPPWVFSGSDWKAAGPKTACLTGVAPSNGTSYPWPSQVCRSVWTSVVMYLCACMPSCFSHVWYSLWPYELWPSRLLSPWDSPDKNTGVGCHVFLQGIFPVQRSNLCLLHCRVLLPRSHQGSPHMYSCAPHHMPWEILKMYVVTGHIQLMSRQEK